MPNLKLVTRIHVLSAIKVHDQMGAEAFLAELGLEGPGDVLLVERGRRYDAPALLAFAYGRATGETVEVSVVAAEAETMLGRLDFTVTTPATLVAAAAKPAAAPRKAAAKKAPSRAKPEPVIALCPRCFMQLPAATGVCNYCD